MKIFRLPENSKELEKLDLSNAQQDAIQQMEQAFHLKNTILLKGVTGSGKTQVYMELIRSALAEGKQVLYMVPEIALTSQLVQRIRRYFPDQTQEYHSGLSNKYRMAVWTSCLEGYHPLFIGARSSVFLPFRNLGLIIVDEEHDPSYKQNDPAPRYNARDTAILLGNEYNAKIILGSATPSVESYHQALSDRIGLVRLDQRYGESQLPDIQVISLKEAKRKGELKGNFSEKLLAEMNTELDNKRQIIVFRNRRGYSPILQCTSCKWESHCTQCAINLTYHKYQHALKCHICGLTQPLPLKCPECGKEDLKLVGFGTEKLEEELRELFPDHEMCMTLGGRVAEDIIFGRISTGAQNDLERITKMAYAMVSIYGMNHKVGNVSFYDAQGEYSFQKPYSDATALMIDEEVRSIIDQAYQRTKNLLTEKRVQLEQLAQELL